MMHTQVIYTLWLHLSPMAKVVENHAFSFHMFIILFYYMLSFAHIQSASTSSLSYCLNLHKITNFTTQNSSPQNEYDHFLRFSLQNLRFTGGVPKPMAIILPTSKEQLVDTVACCRRSSLEMRIRCGGHSYEGMSSTTRGNTSFVIIDMMNLNRVIVDLGSETAWVEGGATLGELYATIAEHSSYHGFPAGVSHTVGVSGHFLGGGFGVMSRKYGLSADNVVDAVLIDGLGRVLDRAQMGDDVFWALRGGGGGNFGIVYGWKVQLVKVPQRVTCFTIFKHGPKPQLAQLVHKWQFVAPYLDDGFYIIAYLMNSESNEVYLKFKGFYLGSKYEAISIIDQYFPTLEIREEEYVEMSWIESVLHFSYLPSGSTVDDLKSRIWSGRFAFKVKSDYVRDPISVEGLEGALDMLGFEPKRHVILDPYGGNMDRISSDKIAFPHRKGNLYNILYVAYWWGEEEDEDRYSSWVRSFYDYMTPFVSSNPRATYVNYVDLDLGTKASGNNNDLASHDNAVEEARAWGEKYFLGNYDRLVKAKTTIDPQNVFNHQQRIPPSYVHGVVIFMSSSNVQRLYTQV